MSEGANVNKESNSFVWGVFAGVAVTASAYFMYGVALGGAFTSSAYYLYTKYRSSKSRA